MSASDIYNDKIIFSIVDTIIDDPNSDYLIEVRIKRSLLDQIFESPKDSFVVDLHNSGFLTARELEVLKFISIGLNNNEIADKLHVSVHTSKAHVQSIFKKLGVTDRTQAVVKAIKENLINVI